MIKKKSILSAFINKTLNQLESILDKDKIYFNLFSYGKEHIDKLFEWINNYVNESYDEDDVFIVCNIVIKGRSYNVQIS